MHKPPNWHAHCTCRLRPRAHLRRRIKHRPMNLEAVAALTPLSTWKFPVNFAAPMGGSIEGARYLVGCRRTASAATGLGML